MVQAGRVVDDLGNTITSWGGGGSSSDMTVTVTPGNNETRTYTVGPGGGTAIVENQGWLGNVQLRADRNPVDANDTQTQLTISLDRPVAGPYQVALYADDTRLYAFPSYLFEDGYNSGNGRYEYTYAVNTPNNTTITYTAYVAQNTPSPGPPTNDIRGEASIAVENQGWLGNVQLRADRNPVDANDTQTQLTISLDRPVAGPYQVALYADDTRLYAFPSYLFEDGYNSGNGRYEYTYAVNTPNNTTITYTAYVAQNTPSPGPPTNDIRGEDEMLVTNAGWQGSVTLSATGPGPSVPVKVALTKPLAGPYVVSIYNDTTDTKIWSTMSPSLFSPSDGEYVAIATLTPPATGTHQYTARVSPAPLPTTGVPGDAAASSSLIFTDGVLSDSAMDQVSIDWLASELAGVSDEEIALALSTFPFALRLQQTSTSDIANAYLAAMLTDGRRAALIKVAKISPGVLWYLHQATRTAPDDVAIPPVDAPGAPPPPLGPPTSPNPKFIIGGGGGVTVASIYLIARDLISRDDTLTEHDAQIQADYCLRYVNRAIRMGALTVPAGRPHPCKDPSITIHYPSGTKWSLVQLPPTVSPSAQHIADALADHPEWTMLNWVNKDDRENSGLRRGWYLSETTGGYTNTNYAACESRPAGFDCDEYPFYSSAQSGPQGFSPGLPNASLQPTPLSDNRSAGSLWGVTADTCGLRSGGSNRLTAAAVGSPALVIPVPIPNWPTRRICRQPTP